MKTLTIITTRAQLLPPHSSKDALFSADNCTCNETQNLNQKDGIKRDKIYRVNGKLIFGLQCLDEKDKGNSNDFIQNLLSDILGLIGDDKTNIEEIFLFAHGDDLGSKPLKVSTSNDHPLLNDSKWFQKLLGGKTVVKGNGGPHDSKLNAVSVYFTAFSHTGAVPIYQVLLNPESFLNKQHKYEFKDKKNFLEDVFSTLAKSLVLGWGAEKSYKSLGSIPSTLINDFQFEGHYWDIKNGVNEIVSAGGRRFLWEKDVWGCIKDSKGGNKINVIFLPMVAISEQNDLHFYTNIESFFKKDNEAPIIFIGSKDIMSHSNSEYLNEEIFFPLDRRYRFLDSSIWYRYVPIEGDFWKNLDKALETISWAYENRLYEKNVCKEFREFQTRMVVNSKLEWLGASGHAKKVFPFTFHSESMMEEEGSKSLKNLDETQLRWNFLMVDDFGETSLNELEGKNDGATKGEIVEQILKIGLLPLAGLTSLASGSENESKLMHSENQDNRIIQQFGISLTIEDATQKLGVTPKVIGTVEGKENNTPKLNAEKPNSTTDNTGIIYDIILLDYLFSNPIGGKEQRDPYGTALLDYIQTAAGVDGIGVMQSYWIYPISVFNEAIQSHLQEKGYQYMEKRWQLSRGADPLNTPHLFRRSLFKFMEAQASKVQFDEKDIWAFMAKEDTFLLKKDEKSETKGLFLDRSKAVVAFRQFTERFSIEEGLPQHSALAESVREKLSKSGTKDLRDHLSQLLYLLGFSVGFDFPIIEQEFKAVKASFQGYKSLNIASRDEIKQIEKSMEDLSIAVYSIHGKYY